MTKLIYAIFLVVLAGIYYLIAAQYQQCEESGGVMVRGLYRLECIKK